MENALFKQLSATPKKQGISVRKTSKQIEMLGQTKPLQVVWALIQGMALTFKHLFRRPVTFNYPNQKRSQSPRFRGIHRLQRHDDGLERCVACGLCGAACPSDAIYIEAAENTDENRVSHGERYAKIYQIDMLRCIFCGYCEEACPEDAIVLGPNWEAASIHRDEFVYTKERMLIPKEKNAELFRKGLTWPSGQGEETAPVSSDLPEFFFPRANQAIPRGEVK